MQIMGPLLPAAVPGLHETALALARDVTTLKPRCPSSKGEQARATYVSWHLQGTGAPFTKRETRRRSRARRPGHCTEATRATGMPCG